MRVGITLSAMVVLVGATWAWAQRPSPWGGGYPGTSASVRHAVTVAHKTPPARAVAPRPGAAPVAGPQTSAPAARVAYHPGGAAAVPAAAPLSPPTASSAMVLGGYQGGQVVGSSEGAGCADGSCGASLGGCADGSCGAPCDTCGPCAPACCGCWGAGRYGHGWLCTTGDMPQHVPYQAEGRGYYYFRPYHVMHVFAQQEMATRWGADPRNPYDNRFFEKFYPLHEPEDTTVDSDDEVSAQWLLQQRQLR